jgi:DNA repair exonuclease SbcCD ATPase subunit
MLKNLALMMAVMAVAAFACGQAMGQVGITLSGTGGGTWTVDSSGKMTQITDPEQMKKMMEEWKKQAAKQMQESLGASDDEWKVLEPKIDKIQELAGQVSGGGRMGRIAFGPAGDAADATDAAKKLKALSDLLKNKDAKAEEVAAALKDYRDAKAKAKEELEKARKELKELLTVKQEAKLVLMGVLE